MNFWETVDSELKYQNKERKDLANAAGFDVSNIGKGIKNGGVPLADTAVRIAQFLNVSVEYLVSGGKSLGSEKNTELSTDFQKFFFYRKLVTKIDSLPSKTKIAIVEMFEALYKLPLVVNVRKLSLYPYGSNKTILPIELLHSI